MSTKFITVPPKTLASTITASDMLLKPSDILGFDGEDLTSAFIGDTWYCTLKDSSGSKLEIMKLDPTTVANWNTTGITILERGLTFYGSDNELTGNKLVWIKGETIINFGTDTPQLWQWFKNYIDGIAIAGSPDSTTSTKGIVKMSVAPVSSTNPIAVGDNDTRVPTQGENDALAGTSGTPSSTNKFVTNNDTAETGASKVIRTKSTGVLDPSIIPLYQTIGFTTADSAGLSGGTTEVTQYTVSIPTTSPFQTDSILKVRFNFTRNFTNGSGNPSYIRIKLGGTTILTETISGADNNSGIVDLYIKNNGSLSSQVISLFERKGSTNTVFTSTSSVDTSSGTIVFAITAQAGTSGDTYVINGLYFEKIK